MNWFGISILLNLSFILLLPSINGQLIPIFSCTNMGECKDNLQLEHNAAWIFNDEAVAITQSEPWKFGALYWKEPVELFQEGFTCEFTFSIDQKATDLWTLPIGGDGFALVFQTYGEKWVINEAGRWMGFRKENPTTDDNDMVAIEFDNFRNANGDIDDNHVAYHSQATPLGQYSVYGTDLNFRDDQQVFRVIVTYEAGLDILTVKINGYIIAQSSFTGFRDLRSPVDGSKAYMGFTSATGRSYQRHKISSFAFSTGFRSENTREDEGLNRTDDTPFFLLPAWIVNSLFEIGLLLISLILIIGLFIVYKRRMADFALVNNDSLEGNTGHKKGAKGSKRPGTLNPVVKNPTGLESIGAQQKRSELLEKKYNKKELLINTPDHSKISPPTSNDSPSQQPMDLNMLSGSNIDVNSGFYSTSSSDAAQNNKNKDNSTYNSVYSDSVLQDDDDDDDDASKALKKDTYNSLYSESVPAKDRSPATTPSSKRKQKSPKKGRASGASGGSTGSKRGGGGGGGGSSRRKRPT